MKIVHISDLHFGMHHEAIINAFLADVSDINPSLTIISGDLTQRAKSAQYKDVQAFIKNCRGQFLPFLGIMIFLYGIFFHAYFIPLHYTEHMFMQSLLQHLKMRKCGYWA
ncbi:putative phosphohydrolase [Legionella oakridgensis ATCC 33761 = DSM 21215]|uniref:Putative phosphohydrolase n=1 Tax=Legionella oakridgensis ATCC 33761 = DSM 21215 TaxID=1268635 RepID=W0BH46_9GAMM|nr:putative phosphohydrolase [Legionella oakridgensis ATCC 33761 = DSM 21215]